MNEKVVSKIQKAIEARNEQFAEYCNEFVDGLLGLKVPKSANIDESKLVTVALYTNAYDPKSGEYIGTVSIATFKPAEWKKHTADMNEALNKKRNMTSCVLNNWNYEVLYPLPAVVVTQEPTSKSKKTEVTNG